MTDISRTRYGLTLYAQNAQEALFVAAKAVLAKGASVFPRGLETKELRHFSVIVEDPRDWAPAKMNAQWSPMIAAAEALQLIGGFSDPKWANPRVPSLMAFTNDDGEFDGAYGPRLGLVFHEVVTRLKTDHDTRQAIVPIYNFEDGQRKASKDYPCTLSLHFLIRNNALDLDVTMRSNDVNWGLKHDLSQFMLLQSTLAELLGIDVGIYSHTANSMHLYAESFTWAEGLTDSPDGSGIPRGGIVSIGPSVDELFVTARDIMYRAEPRNESEVNAWLRKTVHPL